MQYRKSTNSDDTSDGGNFSSDINANQIESDIDYNPKIDSHLYYYTIAKEIGIDEDKLDRTISDLDNGYKVSELKSFIISILHKENIYYLDDAINGMKLKKKLIRVLLTKLKENGKTRKENKKSSK